MVIYKPRLAVFSETGRYRPLPVARDKYPPAKKLPTREQRIARAKCCYEALLGLGDY
jgi:hypothetical protein